MKQFESRLRKIEEQLLPKKSIVVVLDYTTDENESYLKIGKERIIIPMGEEIEKFVSKKINEYKRRMKLFIVGLYISNRQTHEES